MIALYYDLLSTSMGWVGVVASPRGIRRTTLPTPTPVEALASLGVDAAGATHRPGVFAHLHRRLEAYFRGEAVEFNDPVDLEKTGPFFSKAWAACKSIPRGETRSYQWLAAQAGQPDASRAAGQAMARNPIPLLVPCHRVVASDGSLCGFGGGLELKARLLQLERASPRPAKAGQPLPRALSPSVPAPALSKAP